MPVAYAIGLIGIIAAAGGRMLLNQVADTHIPLVAFHLVVLAAAVFGGLGPALFSLLSGYLVAGLVFDAPRGAFGVFGMPDLWATFAYVIVGLAAAATGTALHAMRRQMIANEEQAHAGRSTLLRQLEEAVRELDELKRSTVSLRSGVAPAQAVPMVAAAVRTIRVVDDERDGADSLALLLSMHGYQTEVSYDGLSALAADAPDVLIVDIGLPDINGNDLARRVRVDPRFARTVVIGLSGFSADATGVTAAAFDYYLTKPVELGALRAIIDRL
jgi:CheY-like chemotaxis protein